MKKNYLLTSIFILTALLSSVASAETIYDIRQKVEAAKQKVSEERAVAKAGLSSATNTKEIRDLVETRINKKLDEKKMVVVNVFEKSIQNLKDLVARIESRFAKIEKDNIDISTSKTLLEKTKTNLASAETELAKLENILSNNIPSVSTSSGKIAERKAILKKIKDQSEITKLAIKTTHKSIVDVVVSLKEGLLKNKEATSTKTN